VRKEEHRILKERMQSILRQDALSIKVLMERFGRSRRDIYNMVIKIAEPVDEIDGEKLWRTKQKA